MSAHYVNLEIFLSVISSLQAHFFLKAHYLFVSTEMSQEESCSFTRCRFLREKKSFLMIPGTITWPATDESKETGWLTWLRKSVWWTWGSRSSKEWFHLEGQAATAGKDVAIRIGTPPHTDTRRYKHTTSPLGVLNGKIDWHWKSISLTVRIGVCLSVS